MYENGQFSLSESHLVSQLIAEGVINISWLWDDIFGKKSINPNHNADTRSASNPMDKGAYNSVYYLGEIQTWRPVLLCT